MRRFTVPERFWGHPDSWSDKTWDEYERLRGTFWGSVLLMIWGVA